VIAHDDEPRFRREAERVSSVALAAVVVVALSGAVQAVLFLPTLGALLSTPYGWILIWKMIGMAVLIAFGAHHRYRVMPARPLRPAVVHAMATSELAWPLRLRRSVWRELAVMGIVILLGAWLAYVSPNATYPPTAADGNSGTTHR
jgi:putative copper export protein